MISSSYSSSYYFDIFLGLESHRLSQERCFDTTVISLFRNSWQSMVGKRIFQKWRQQDLIPRPVSLIPMCLRPKSKSWDQGNPSRVVRQASHTQLPSEISQGMGLQQYMSIQWILCVISLSLLMRRSKQRKYMITTVK